MGLTSVFVAAIFVGSVWLGKISLPFSILALPFFFVDRRQLSLRLPPAAVPLIVMGAIIGIQFALNFGNPTFRWKADLAVWLPLVFAGATIVALRYSSLMDGQALRAMVIGGALTSAIMVAMIVFAPTGFFLLPGQDATKVEDNYSKQLAQEAAQSINSGKQTATDISRPAGREAFAPVSQGQDIAFYETKNRARNMLGVSNYIAVFLVFLFAVTLFSGMPWLAAMFVVLTTLTLARFGMVIVGIVLCIYFIRRKIEPTKAASVAAAVLSISLASVYLFQSYVPHIPGSSSILARFEYWRSGIDALALHPIIGAPRSVFLVELGNSITWNPHNSILWVAVNFGLVGLAAYCLYVWIVVREIAKASWASDLWKGIFVGTILILAWSLEEIIVLTPAFEILLAALYVMALNRNRAVGQQSKT